jgi:hypothetical protein
MARSAASNALRAAGESLRTLCISALKRLERRRNLAGGTDPQLRLPTHNPRHICLTDTGEIGKFNLRNAVTPLGLTDLLKKTHL